MAGSTKDLLNMMGKLGKSGKNMFSKKEETKVLTMKIARNEAGSFGVMLNDHNRVCSDTARARADVVCACARVCASAPQQADSAGLARR